MIDERIHDLYTLCLKFGYSLKVYDKTVLGKSVAHHGYRFCSQAGHWIWVARLSDDIFVGEKCGKINKKHI